MLRSTTPETPRPRVPRSALVLATCTALLFVCGGCDYFFPPQPCPQFFGLSDSAREANGQAAGGGIHFRVNDGDCQSPSRTSLFGGDCFEPTVDSGIGFYLCDEPEMELTMYFEGVDSCGHGSEGPSISGVDLRYRGVRYTEVVADTVHEWWCPPQGPIGPKGMSVYVSATVRDTASGLTAWLHEGEFGFDIP